MFCTRQQNKKKLLQHIQHSDLHQRIHCETCVQAAICMGVPQQRGECNTVKLYNVHASLRLALDSHRTDQHSTRSAVQSCIMCQMHNTC